MKALLTLKHRNTLVRTALLLFSCAAAVLLLTCSPGNRTQAAVVDELLSQVAVQPVLGERTFEIDGQSFYRLVIPQYVMERFGESSYAIYPGQADPRVAEIKQFLFSDDHFKDNEFVTYTQIRPPKAAGEEREWIETYFDDHLAVFFKTLYLFCGLEDKEPCLDELTRYLVEWLPNATQPMKWDIEVAYKHTLIREGMQGTVGRDGTLDTVYYFAQTDPDWGGEEFKFFKIPDNPTYPNGVTIKDRGCGCACASMVFSSYLMVEITPRITAKYADQGSWHVSYGLPNEYFIGIAKPYYNYKRERYITTLPEPVILDKSDVDMSVLIDQIGSQGYMAIIHVKSGAFTSQEHYMVLQDYEEIDGQGYFLVADPYMQPNRYKGGDQIRKKDDSTNEGLLYATPELLYRDCMSLILFPQDRRAFAMECKAAGVEAQWIK